MNHQGQGHPRNQQNSENGNGSGPGSHGYTSQNDDYHTFFNHNVNPSFSAPWGAEAIIDPRIQSNGFAQPSAAWHQNTLNAPTALQAPTYGLQSNYSNAFARPQDAYSSFSSFNPQQPNSFTNPNFDPALAYGSDALLNDNAFGDHESHHYGRSSVQGQTISPSALQSFSYPPFAAAADDTQLPIRTGNSAPRSTLPVYDDRQTESMAAASPGGVQQDGFLVKDSGKLVKATDSKPFTGFIFLGGKVIQADDSRVILPKAIQRKSKKSLKKEIFIHQGSTPWNTDQASVAKKLKLSNAEKPRLPPNGSASRNETSINPPSTSPSASASESDAEDDSEYSSESERETEADEKSPLPSSRPSDPKKAIDYDVIKSVWSKRRNSVAPAAIRAALGTYAQLVNGLRNKWKIEATALALAEEQKDKSQTALRSSRAGDARDTLDRVFRLTIQYGHPDIIARFGEIPPLFLAFSQLVSDRLKVNDHNGPLVMSILQLMIRCSTVDQEMLEKAKLDKVLPRVIKKGNDETKALAQKVLDSAEKWTKQKSADSKNTSNVESLKTDPFSTASPSIRATEPVPAAKRQRDSAAATVIVPKKSMVAELSKSSLAASNKTPGSLAKGIQAVKVNAKPSTNPPIVNTTTPKLKVNHVIARPSVFSSLQSASKKPGTSIAALKAANQSDSKSGKTIDGKPSGTSMGAVAPKPAFSFAETMANLTKPKEIPTAAKSEADRPPETDEERKKRLRKEERRKLRVSFKPEGELVQIQIFTHDPEEDMGHDDSMIRDVGDVGGEGRMLKMHKDLDMIDDDEEVTGPEEELVPWNTPSSVDFSDIPDDELNRNCSTRGGRAEIKSHERVLQNERELNTLMVFYSSPSDIPSSPREPADPYSGEPSVECMFGEPQDETRLREAQFFASQRPVAFPANPVAPSAAPTPDINALLQILNSQPQVPQPPQPQQQIQLQQPQSSGLEAIFAKFAGARPAPAQPQVASQSGFLDPSIQAALAAINANSFGQQAYPTPQPVQNQTTDLQALLSHFAQASNSTSQTYSYQNSYQNEGDRDRKRQLDPDDQRQDDQYSDGKRVRGNNGKKFFGVPRVPCKFWHEAPRISYLTKLRSDRLALTLDHGLQPVMDDIPRRPPRIPSGRQVDLDPHHLIIVCCHAIWLGGLANGRIDNEWAIEPFQEGETLTFIQHIKAGIEAVKKDPNAVLAVSGGATKPHRTSLTEAESYCNLARANNYFDLLPPSSGLTTSQWPTASALPNGRPIILDVHATDSYQNLLFPLLLFIKQYQDVPKKITVISHAFKRQRFVDLHCRALRWPVKKFDYVGIDPVKDEEGRKWIEEGEARAVAAWRADLYGTGADLGEKRRRRGWEGYEAIIEGYGGRDIVDSMGRWVPELLGWNGGDTGMEIYSGELGWDLAKQNREVYQ